MEFALDANIIIHLMRGTKSVELKVENAKSKGARFIIPYTVHYEITRGLHISKIAKHVNAYGIICTNCSIESITDEVWDRAASVYVELYRKRFTVADADILIAAFCLLRDYTLVTGNTNDFMNIDDLNIESWV